MTSKLPFGPKLYGRGILHIVTHGHTVDKPAEIADALWDILKSCWSHSPDDRATMATVESALTIL
jgi:hypothetical protein